MCISGGLGVGGGGKVVGLDMRMQEGRDRYERVVADRGIQVGESGRF